MIVVIDYGLGNLRSVAKALELAGAEVIVTNEPKKINDATAIVFPGVGAFSKGMENLEKLDILPVLLKSIKNGTPFLGLCLGLQLLFTQSEEHGAHKGLDIIKGEVKRFTGKIKVPHMGWNQVKQRTENTCPTASVRRGEQRTDLLKGVPDNSYFYFVHSYYVVPEDKSIISTTTDYGIEFVSSIQKDNIFGLQFHPEKSSELGLKLLSNFVSMLK